MILWLQIAWSDLIGGFLFVTVMGDIWPRDKMFDSMKETHRRQVSKPEVELGLRWTCCCICWGCAKSLIGNPRIAQLVLCWSSRRQETSYCSMCVLHHPLAPSPAFQARTIGYNDWTTNNSDCFSWPRTTTHAVSGKHRGGCCKD